LTPERRERIVSALEDGIPIAIVAQNVGARRSKLHEWISSGRVVRHRRPEPLELVPKIAAAEGASSSTSDSLEEQSVSERRDRRSGERSGWNSRTFSRTRYTER
jgi:hypothetical protein